VHQGQRVVRRELQGVWHWREQLPALRVKAAVFVNAKDSKPVG
jgi:hypothetical protein